ncbi:translocation/assembly module TamB domain-containing protein [Acidisoma sp.]|uniref:translocation/assembly module TamB domain-containing protein n=1 Tax=Acidisoma sp. TaxID=1872115 RepID=UPI003B00F807
MRVLGTITKWLGIAIGVLLLLVIVLVGGVIAAINTAAGQREVVSLANAHSGGAFRIEGLSGTVPTDLHVARFELLGPDGAWLTLTGLELQLSLMPLLHRSVVIDRLHADTLTMARLPPSSPTAKPAPPSGPISASIPPLPVKVFLRQLTVDRIKVAKAVTSTAAIEVGLTGAAQVTGRDEGQAHLALRDLDGSGVYTAQASLAGQDLAAKVNLQEPARGMLSRLAKLPDLGALHLAITLDGPQDKAAVNLALSAGALKAGAKGTVDVPGEAADLAIDAHAPAMKPAPGIGWQSVDVALHTSGPFTKPDANGHIVLTGLAAQGVALQRLTADIQGTLGAVSLKASLAGLAAPGLPQGLLGDTPVSVTANAVLDAPNRPVHVTVTHPLLTLHVDGTTKPDLAAAVVLDLPDLAPLAAIGHQTIAGSAHITAQATRAADGSATAAKLQADIHLTKAMPQAMALTGGDAHLTADATMTPSAITLSSLTLHGADIDLTAQGSRQTATQQLALAWTLALRRLADVAPQATGAIAMTGHAQGTQKNIALTTEVTGTVGTAQGGSKVASLSGPIDLRVEASGLPGAPHAQITLTGNPAGSPADIAVDASRDADGAISATIKRLTWKSMSGQGQVALASGAKLPTGTVSVVIKRLADFRFLIGQPLSGSIALNLKAPPNEAAQVALQGRDLAFAANRLAAVDVTGDVRDPTTNPAVAARIVLSGIDAGGIKGGATITADGPLTALALGLDARLPDLKGAPASANMRATLDAKAKQVVLAALAASWHGEALRLLAPARIDFGSRMAVDRLRLALGTATIDAAGQVSPRLNLHVGLSNVTPALIAPFAPSLHLAGRIDAEAALTGTTAAPGGTVTLNGNGLRETSGPASALPAATLMARAALHGQAAALNVTLDAGSASHVTLTGMAPISAAAAMNLRIGGKLNLALIDPIMEAAGRRVAGVVTLDLSALGTMTAPRIGGSVALNGGSFQDFAQGVDLSRITALIRADGQDLVIEHFNATAGTGSIDVAGRIGALAPTIPLDLTVTAHNAEPIQSDLLTARFDTDIHVSGAVTNGMKASGTVHILRASINVPNSLPPSVAVLNVRKAGQKPPPPPAPPPPIGLDLTLEAPRAIFVRGHGLNAELGGHLHIGGTLAALKPSGHFDMIRGSFSLVTTTLTFTTGQVGFDGGDITDPSIDFVAESESSAVTATLAVTGYASAPKITLSSSPPLPQDEVLAQLLFQSSTSQLSPFQLASIATALASIAGVDTGGGVGGMLGSVRQGLGLDQLSIGNGIGNPTGATPSAGSAASKNENAPTLQAGRYVAPGIYVGAAQGTTGTGTAAQVQIDIAKGLKLQTQVGGDSNGVGVTYQFNY